MKVLNFRGAMAPVFTGFRENYELNVDIVPEYAKFLSDNGVTGILVNGTTGEGVSMTSAERKSNLEAWMKEAGNYNLTVMVQIGGTSFTDVIDLARHAVTLKVHALLSLPELFFYPQSVEDIVQYLRDISEAVPDTPLFYYHIPMFTRVSVDTESLMRQCKEKVPSFGGIKFTHTNLEELQRTMQVDENLLCFLGCDQLILSALQLGCTSQLASTINICPDMIKKIYDFHETDYKQARKVQNHLTDLTRKITANGSWVSTMKQAMNLLHKCDMGPVRRPLRADTLSTDASHTLKTLL